MTRHTGLTALATIVVGLVCLVQPAHASGLKNDVREKSVQFTGGDVTNSSIGDPVLTIGDQRVETNDLSSITGQNSSAVVVGTAGANNNVANWDANGDLVSDGLLNWFSSSNTLAISGDSGQTGLAFVISSDTGATLANISHDGIAYFENLELNNELTADVAINLGVTGVRLTHDSDGAITFTSRGGGNSEDLTINLDDTSNLVSLSSSTGVTTIEFQAASSPTIEIESTLNSSGPILMMWANGDDWRIRARGSATSTPNALIIDNDTDNTNVFSTDNSNNIYIGSQAMTTTSVLGSGGGCLMFLDTDQAGWTECDALNGTLSCSVDADGICD